MFKFIKKHHISIILLLILVFALILRFNGIYLDLPSGGGGAAEVNPSNNALRLFEYKQIIPDFRVNTHGIILIYINALIYAFVFSFSILLGIFENLTEIRTYLILNREILVLFSRIFFVVLNTVSVYLIYLIAKKLFNKKIGLVAAFIFAVNFYYIVIIARRAAVWGLMMFFILIALYYAVSVFRSGRAKHYFLSALFASFAFGTHFVGGIGFIPLLAAHFLRQEKIFSRKAIINRKLIWSVIIFLSFLLVFIAINPTAWTFYMEEGMYYEVTRTNGFESGYEFSYLAPFYYVFKFIFQFMPIVSLFAFLGIITLFLKKKRRELLLILSLPIFYYFYVGPLSAFSQERFFSPMIPFVMILSAFGIVTVADKIKFKKIILLILSFVVVLPSLYFSYMFTLASRQGHVENNALEWIYTNIPENSYILLQTTGGHFTTNENKEFIKFIDNNFDPYFFTFKRQYLLNLPKNEYPQPAYFSLDTEIVHEEALVKRIIKDYKFDYFILMCAEECDLPEHRFLNITNKRELVVVFHSNDTRNELFSDKKFISKIVESPFRLLKDRIRTRIEIYKLK